MMCTTEQANFQTYQFPEKLAQQFKGVSCSWSRRLPAVKRLTFSSTDCKLELFPHSCPPATVDGGNKNKKKRRAAARVIPGESARQVPVLGV